MERNKVVSNYLKKSKENFEFYNFLSYQEKYLEWQVVAIFYSALCYVKAYFYSKNSIPINSVNSHLSIKHLLSKEANAKRLKVLMPYEILYNESRDARYKCKSFTNKRVEKVLSKYEEVKQSLNIVEYEE